jgi:hypothetical protein
MSLVEDRRVKWSRLLEEHRSSGLPVSEWCRREGVHPTSFYEWRRRLGALSASLSAPEWLAVSPCDVLTNASGSSVSAEVCAPVSAGLTLRIGRVSIDLCAGFDRGVLSEALDVLESRTC